MPVLSLCVDFKTAENFIDKYCTQEESHLECKNEDTSSQCGTKKKSQPSYSGSICTGEAHKYKHKKRYKTLI